MVVFTQPTLQSQTTPTSIYSLDHKILGVYLFHLPEEAAKQPRLSDCPAHHLFVHESPKISLHIVTGRRNDKQSQCNDSGATAETLPAGLVPFTRFVLHEIISFLVSYNNSVFANGLNCLPVRY